MLKQTRPAKFKLPVSYVDLLSGEELAVPEVVHCANSYKYVSLPSKIVKRRARLETLKTANKGMVASEPPAEEQTLKREDSQTVRPCQDNLVKACFGRRGSRAGQGRRPSGTRMCAHKANI